VGKRREIRITWRDHGGTLQFLTYDEPDERKDYGEPRIVTAGFLKKRMVVVVRTPRDGGRHIMSMRKTNDREKSALWAAI
jgi:uncharacterized protein